MEAQRQNTLEAVLCQMNAKFCCFLVKSFAYYVSEYQTQMKSGKSIESYMKVSTHDMVLDQCPESVKCINLLCT